MKILVINGSPKKEASDTMKITRAFLEGMNDVSGQDVKKIHVIDKDIQYCKGCFTCMHNGGTCVYNARESNVWSSGCRHRYKTTAGTGT